MRRADDAGGELGRLAASLCDGRITPEEGKRLEQLASRSPGTLRYLVRYVHLDAELHWDAAVGARQGRPTSFEPRPELQLGADLPSRAAVERVRRRSSYRWTGIAAVATAILVGVLGTLLLLSPVAQQDTTRRVAVGTLVRSIDARWPEGAAAVSAGAALAADQYLHLREGLAEIRFLSGARAVLEGPVRFRLQTARGGFLESGSLAVHVPAQAKGFTIDTPTATIVDLGTEIGVAVERGGTSEVHVFTGKVEVRPVSEGGSPALQRELGADQALRISRRPGADPQVREIPLEPDRFVRTMPARASVEKLRKVVAADPHLSHHYTFEGGTYGEKCCDKHGALDLTRVLMLGGTDGGDFYELAPGLDETSNAVRPYRSRQSGNTVGVGLESTGRFVPPSQMTLELLLRLELSSGATEGMIGAAVAVPTSDREVTLLGVAVEGGRLAFCLSRDASASLDRPQFVPGHWYYVAASLESASGRTKVNCYVADLSQDAPALRRAVKDAIVEAVPSPGRLGIGKGYDQNLKAAYPWPGSLDEIAIYATVLGPDELREHVEALTAREP